MTKRKENAVDTLIKQVDAADNEQLADVKLNSARLLKSNFRDAKKNLKDIQTKVEKELNRVTTLYNKNMDTIANAEHSADIDTYAISQINSLLSLRDINTASEFLTPICDRLIGYPDYISRIRKITAHPEY